MSNNSLSESVLKISLKINSLFKHHSRSEPVTHMHKHTPAHTHAWMVIYNIWHTEKCQNTRTNNYTATVIVKLVLAIKEAMTIQWGCASQNMINSINICSMINTGWLPWQGYTISQFAAKKKKKTQFPFIMNAHPPTPSVTMLQEPAVTLLVFAKAPASAHSKSLVGKSLSPQYWDTRWLYHVSPDNK